MTSSSRLRDPRMRSWLLVLVAAAYGALHIAAVFTESVNWDEFALLYRAEKAARVGVIDGGGRPGLGVVALIPFVDGCTSTTTVVHMTRLVWAAVTLSLLAGVFFFVLRATRRTPHRWQAAVLATALIALVPVFMRWSLQVRTDQPAVAACLWAGVALLASRERTRMALVAGASIGTGYLFSQKAIYVTALIVLIAAGDVFVDRELSWRRELRRAVLVVAGAALALGTYAVVVRGLFEPPAPVSIERGLDLFRWYRDIIGFRVYAGMFETLLPHLLLLGLLMFALARASRTRAEHLRPLIVAMLVVLLGLAVGAFHAAAFPYFWFTLGLFPAVAVGIAWPGILELVPRLSRVLGALAVAWLLYFAVPYRLETLQDTQQVQVSSMRFMDALDPSLRGFHPDGGLVCRRDPSPLPVFLRETVVRWFSGPDADQNTAKLLAEFRSRPVAFLVQTHRVSQFPPVVRAFWQDHYVPYVGPVAIAGRRVHGVMGSVHALEVIVPGTYRWQPINDGPARISIHGRVIDRGQTFELPLGPASIRLLDAVDGLVAIDVGSPPRPSHERFYHRLPLAEITGARRRW